MHATFWRSTTLGMHGLIVYDVHVFQNSMQVAKWICFGLFTSSAVYASSGCLCDCTLGHGVQWLCRWLLGRFPRLPGRVLRLRGGSWFVDTCASLFVFAHKFYIGVIGLISFTWFKTDQNKKPLELARTDRDAPIHNQNTSEAIRKHQSASGSTRIHIEPTRNY